MGEPVSEAAALRAIRAARELMTHNLRRDSALFFLSDDQVWRILQAPGLAVHRPSRLRSSRLADPTYLNDNDLIRVEAAARVELACRNATGAKGFTERQRTGQAPLMAPEMRVCFSDDGRVRLTDLMDRCTPSREMFSTQEEAIGFAGAHIFHLADVAQSLAKVPLGKGRRKAQRLRAALGTVRELIDDDVLEMASWEATAARGREPGDEMIKAEIEAAIHALHSAVEAHTERWALIEKRNSDLVHDAGGSGVDRLIRQHLKPSFKA